MGMGGAMGMGGMGAMGMGGMGPMGMGAMACGAAAAVAVATAVVVVWAVRKWAAVAGTGCYGLWTTNGWAHGDGMLVMQPARLHGRGPQTWAWHDAAAAHEQHEPGAYSPPASAQPPYQNGSMPMQAMGSMSTPSGGGSAFSFIGGSSFLAA